jgi:hypothetical protein
MAALPDRPETRGLYVVENLDRWEREQAEKKQRRA